ncbi:MAG: YcjF family protein [Synechococcales cyanobacterium RU_4_20]|nr:YcjF family protein [Synechococcales cyanobacterium RU_4_20]
MWCSISKTSGCPRSQAALLSQVRSHLQSTLAAGDVVAIAAQPSPLTVVQPQPDGSVRQHQTHPQPELALLLDRLDQLLVAEPPQRLVWKTLEHQAQGLEAAAKALLNTLRRNKSLKLVEQYQWVSAGAAFVNPLPSLDLLATAAVNSQLIVDLAKVYQQPLSLDHAKTMATAMAELLIKLGCVEVSTQLLGTVLKTQGVTYIAGGAIQGASAAYLTRVVGLSLIDYFQALAIADPLPEEQSLERLRQVLQNTFQTSRQTNVLQAFVTQAIQRLKPEKVALQHPLG